MNFKNLILLLALTACGSEATDPSSVDSPAVQALAPVEIPSVPEQTAPEAPQEPASAPDAGTPAPTPPKPVPAAPVPAQRFVWGLPAGSACTVDVECQSGDLRVIERCTAGTCTRETDPAGLYASSYCQTDPTTVNYLVSVTVPGPMQEEGLEPEAYMTPPSADVAGACESPALYSEVATDHGRAPGAECESWSQCQDSDPCTQNACVLTGKTATNGKKLGVCRVRAKLDGERRGFIFSDEWAVGTCQGGAASDAGKLHGPCRSDGTCDEGSCRDSRWPWTRVCK